MFESAGIRLTVFSVTCIFILSITVAHFVNRLVELPFQSLINTFQRKKFDKVTKPKKSFVKKVNALIVASLLFSIIGINTPGSISYMRNLVFTKDLLGEDSISVELETDTAKSQIEDKGSKDNLAESTTSFSITVPKFQQEQMLESLNRDTETDFPLIFKIQSELVKRSLQLKVADSDLLSRIAKLKNERDLIWSGCLDGFTKSSRCNRLSESKKFEALIIGDSFALSWYPAVENALPLSWDVKSFTLGQCEFSRVDSLQNGEVFEECLAHRESVDERILELKPDLIVVSSSWGAAYRGNLSDWQAGLVSHLDFLQRTGAAVLFIGNVPGTQNWSDCLKRDSIAGCNGLAERGSQRRNIEIKEAKSKGFATLDPTPLLCYKSTCPSTIGGIPVYWDGSHMSKDLSRELAPFIKHALQSRYSFP
jgi:hypothetical protein